METRKVYFVGAGPGAVDLITVRGRDLLARADVIVYAGSLVNPGLLQYARAECEVHDSASMTLEDVIEVMTKAVRQGLLPVRLHTGDPSLYGAIREQMDELRRRNIDFEVVPGVSSFSAAAAALEAEYTLPGVSQSLIITRGAGRTPVPEGESLSSYAQHRTSMALFLTSGLIERACRDLIEGGYDGDTPAAMVYKASWPEQKTIRATLKTLAAEAARHGIDKTALILVGDFLGGDYERSLLYHPSFSHGYRDASVTTPESGSGHTEAAPSVSRIVIAAFTRDGVATARRVQAGLGGTVYAPSRYLDGGADARPLDGSVGDWALEHFRKTDAMIFVSAAGIAIRAVAPCVASKTSDPAVVCLDDMGQNVIPLLSGHIGGANELAERIAALTGGRPVVTTATDVHGIEAVDTWARKRDMTIENPAAIRDVSAAMLDDCRVGVAVTEHLLPPPWPVTLWLRPKNLVLGVGCKKGIEREALAAAIANFLDGAGVSPLSLKAAASIDLKKEEPALVDWAQAAELPFLTYSAQELDSLAGDFSSSEWVKETTGTDNVCERAALCAANALSGAGRSGTLLRSKTVYPGITLALAGIRGTQDGE